MSKAQPSRLEQARAGRRTLIMKEARGSYGWRRASRRANEITGRVIGVARSLNNYHRSARRPAVHFMANNLALKP